MTKLIDLVGQRYNHLTVIKRAEGCKNPVKWECLCDCGNTTIVRGGNLKSGAVKSCGCLCHTAAANKTHGASKTTLYKKWYSMMRRCHNPKSQAYKYYGARGIKVCQEWHTFEIFQAWVESTRTSPDMSLERKDNDGDYCPENCIWASLKTQANNRRSNVSITYLGETHNLTEWCALLNLDYKLIHNRMGKLGWSFEKAINTPLYKSKSSKGRKGT